MSAPPPAGRRYLFLATLVALLAVVADAAAQPRQPLSRIPAFGRNPVGVADSTALVVNPANLAFLPGAELRWSGQFLDEAAPVTWQGHAFGLAVPIPLIPLATGLRMDVLDPTRRASELFFGGTDANHQWLTWGLALRTGETSALGLSIQRSFADSALPHALTSWSLAYTTRPFDHLGAAFVAHHINSPRNEVGTGLERAYDLALAVRPDGTRLLELGLVGQVINTPEDTYVGKATVGLDVEPFGQLRGEVAVTDPFEWNRSRSYLAGLSLAFYLNGPGGSGELAATSLVGDDLGEAEGRPHVNLQGEIATRRFREPVGVDAPTYALRVRIEETPGLRGHVALLRKLWDIAENEPTIAAVVFELRTSPAASLARVQELRDAVYYLRAHGKRTLCHMEDATGGALYMCSATDKILINPAGGVRFAGLRTRYIYYKGLLDKLGIRGDFVRISPHKSAPEALTRKGSSPEAHADHIDLLQQYELGFSVPIAKERDIPLAKLRERFASGPFIAREAKEAGLVDGFAFDDQLEEEVGALTGDRRIALLEDRRRDRAPEQFGKRRKLAIVYVHGDMVDGRSQTVPFVGVKLAGSYTIKDALEDVRKDPQVGAVVLRIETGGGSAMAADVIWREVKVLAKTKPVIVSMGSAAASGGYYIAAPATKILANPLSITGSIGIFYGKLDIAGLLRKLDVHVETYKTSPRADAETIFRPFSEAERKELKKKVHQFYDMFLSRVAEGRGKSKEEIDRFARGRVWTGRQAYRHNLVDELGGLRQAIAHARKLGGLEANAPIVEYPDTPSLIGMVRDVVGARSDQEQLPLPPAMQGILKELVPLMYFDSDQPLARMPWVELSP